MDLASVVPWPNSGHAFLVEYHRNDLTFFSLHTLRNKSYWPAKSLLLVVLIIWLRWCLLGFLHLKPFLLCVWLTFCGEIVLYQALWCFSYEESDDPKEKPELKVWGDKDRKNSDALVWQQGLITTSPIVRQWMKRTARETKSFKELEELSVEASLISEWIGKDDSWFIWGVEGSNWGGQKSEKRVNSEDMEMWLEGAHYCW